MVVPKTFPLIMAEYLDFPKLFMEYLKKYRF